jgi:hypothetical protein
LSKIIPITNIIQVTKSMILIQIIEFITKNHLTVYKLKNKIF